MDLEANKREQIELAEEILQIMDNSDDNGDLSESQTNNVVHAANRLAELVQAEKITAKPLQILHVTENEVTPVTFEKAVSLLQGSCHLIYGRAVEEITNSQRGKVIQIRWKKIAELSYLPTEFLAFN